MSKNDKAISSQDESVIDDLLLRLGAEQLNALQLVRRRKHMHNDAKVLQPVIKTGMSQPDWYKLAAFLRAPISEQEANQPLDLLLPIVIDCVEGKQMEDAIFAMARVVRWAWARQPHLGSIEPKKAA